MMGQETYLCIRGREDTMREVSPKPHTWYPLASHLWLLVYEGRDKTGAGAYY